MISTLLIINLYLNSILFMLCNFMFIFTLNYDLCYISMHLQVRPDMEFFVDTDDNEKLI